jgi:hypothetical protein
MTKPTDFITPGTIVLMSRGSEVYGTKIDNHDEDLTQVYIGSLKINTLKEHFSV